MTLDRSEVRRRAQQWLEAATVVPFKGWGNQPGVPIELVRYLLALLDGQEPPKEEDHDVSDSGHADAGSVRGLCVLSTDKGTAQIAPEQAPKEPQKDDRVIEMARAFAYDRHINGFGPSSKLYNRHDPWFGDCNHPDCKAVRDAVALTQRLTAVEQERDGLRKTIERFQSGELLGSHGRQQADKLEAQSAALIALRDDLLWALKYVDCQLDAQHTNPNDPRATCLSKQCVRYRKVVANLASQEPSRCETCRHWVYWERDKGNCRLAERGHDDGRPSIIEAEALLTDKRFSCAEWEAPEAHA